MIILRALFALNLLVPTNVTAPSPVERNLLAARESLSSGKVVLTTRRTDPRYPDATAIERRYRATFSGENVQVSEYLSHLDRPEMNGKKGVEFRNISRADGQFLAYVEGKMPDGRPLAAKTVERPYSREQSLVDPRLVGFAIAPFSHLNGKPLNYIIGNKDRLRTDTRLETVDGSELTVVDYTLSSGSIVRLWVNDDRQPFLVRGEITFDGGRCKDRLVVKNREWPGSAVVFPESVVFDRYCDGKHVSHETIKVESAEFNQQVDEREFTVDGLNLPVGTPVISVPAKGTTQIWNGEKLVSAIKSGSSLKPAVSIDEPHSGITIRRFVMATSLAVLSVACIGLFLRSRAKKVPIDNL